MHTPRRSRSYMFFFRNLPPKGLTSYLSYLIHCTKAHPPGVLLDHVYAGKALHHFSVPSANFGTVGPFGAFWVGLVTGKFQGLVIRDVSWFERKIWLGRRIWIRLNQIVEMGNCKVNMCLMKRGRVDISPQREEGFLFGMPKVHVLCTNSVVNLNDMLPNIWFLFELQHCHIVMSWFWPPKVW